MRVRVGVVVAVAAALSMSACSVFSSEQAPEQTPEQAPAPEETATQPSAEATPEAPAPSTQPSPTATVSPEAQARVPEDVREKAASLMVVGVSDFDSALAALNLGVGGIIVPSWADPALFTEEGRNIHALREIVGRPFTVAIDFEGGRVQRHTDVFGAFPSPREMTGMSPEEVRGMAYDIGTSLRTHGVTVDYAPLLDVDVVGLEIMGDRSFGSAPEAAAGYGISFARGLADAGVTPTFKHFPGHGQASADTHLAEAVTPHLDELKQIDLLPYGEAIPAVPQASVMMGHMIVPGLGDGQTPSTLNPAAYQLLRSGDYPGGVPFHGVAVTDDLSGMRAITERMSTAEAVTSAISAGADQALWSSGRDVEFAIDGVVGAVESGEIPGERIDSAAARVQQQFIDAGL